MKKLIIIVGTIFLLNSCRMECFCEKDLGCLIVKIKKKYTDSIVADTIICSMNNYYSDTTIKQIAGLFWSRYYQPPYELVYESKDSIYKRLKVEGMSKWDETENLRNQGYLCSCVK